jgi:hypothetical protein
MPQVVGRVGELLIWLVTVVGIGIILYTSSTRQNGSFLTKSNLIASPVLRLSSPCQEVTRGTQQQEMIGYAP